MGNKKQNREKFERALLNIKNNNVKEVDLSNCKLNDDDIQRLAEALKGNTRLQVLYLQNNSITDVGVRYLTERLTHNKVLGILNLDDNSISDEGGQELVRMFEVNTTLFALYVGNKKTSFFGSRKRNKIKDSTQHRIEGFLERNRSLKVMAFIDLIKEHRLTEKQFHKGWLTVPYLQFSDWEIAKLMRVVAHNPYIKGLRFDQYEVQAMSEEKIRLIAKALKKNIDLEGLDLSHVRFTDKGSHLIADALSCNTKLKYLDLSHSTFTADHPPMKLKVETSTSYITDGNLRRVAVHRVTAVKMTGGSSSRIYLRQVLENANKTLQDIVFDGCKMEGHTLNSITLLLQRNKLKRKEDRKIEEKIKHLEQELKKVTKNERTQSDSERKRKTKMSV